MAHQLRLAVVGELRTAAWIYEDRMEGGVLGLCGWHDFLEEEESLQETVPKEETAGALPLWLCGVLSI